MGKVGKIIFFSDQFNIDRKVLAKNGIFNPMLNLDTHLFIDPLLLKSSKHSIIREQGLAEYNEFFSNIIRLLPKSKHPGDFVWNVVKSKFPQKEIGGTCLGYGTNSISGKGISDVILTSLLDTAKQIIDIGITDENRSFVLYFLFDINLEIIVGYEKIAIVDKSDIVGVSKL